MVRKDRSFISVYEECLSAVYGYFGYRISSRAVVEDLTQDTFERALAAWDRFDPDRASPKTWLLAIAHNLLIDHHRRGTGRELTPLPEEDHEHLPEMTVPPIDTHLGIDPQLAMALDQLDDRARKLIALRYGADLTGPEIAGVTGLTLANVQQILSRSLRQMRSELQRSSIKIGNAG